jgi:thymidylate kinase
MRQTRGMPLPTRTETAHVEAPATRGLFVAILGCDGSGKTTLADDLIAALGGRFSETALFHVRPGLIARRAPDSPPPYQYGDRPHRRGRWLIKLAGYVVDDSLGYWVKVRPVLRRSGLVLFDRYFDDLLVDPARYRYGGPEWLVRGLCRVVPRPHLILVLDLPEGQVLDRKQELPADELRRLRAGYQRLAAGLPNTVLLDAGQPREVVAREAAGHILRRLAGG